MAKIIWQLVHSLFTLALARVDTRANSATQAAGLYIGNSGDGDHGFRP